MERVKGLLRKKVTNSRAKNWMSMELAKKASGTKAKLGKGRLSGQGKQKIDPKRAREIAKGGFVSWARQKGR